MDAVQRQVKKCMETAPKRTKTRRSGISGIMVVDESRKKICRGGALDTSISFHLPYIWMDIIIIIYMR